VLYVAAGPQRTEDGTAWEIVYGLIASDGIVALDVSLRYDPQAVTVRDVRQVGLAAGFGIQKKHREGSIPVALYGTAPMFGSGGFLSVRYNDAGINAGLPFELEVTANEGQIPVTWNADSPANRPRPPVEFELLRRSELP
jgi:hypothetical protein